MCGIFVSLSTASSVLPTEETCRLLRNRGPDSFQVHTSTVQKGNLKVTTSLQLTFLSTVLSLRGDHVYSQPLVDEASKSVLCWNGEAWKVAGERVQDNDTELIFSLFLQAVRPYHDSEQSEITTTDRKAAAARRLADVVGSISGPFSFVFYDAFNSKLFFSRDCLGRRSLLREFDDAGNLKICSICDDLSSSRFEEVATDGLHMIDLEHVLEQGASCSESAKDVYCAATLSWDSENVPESPLPRLRNPIPAMNKTVPEGAPPPLNINSPSIAELEQKLRQSLELRVQNVPHHPDSATKNDDATVAVLFSGGLDCTILSRLCHDILPSNETIDLLNVAFENPRVAAAAASATAGKRAPANSIYENCPDRVTGRAAYEELQKVCPDRNWRFVAVDVPYAETLVHRDTIKRLMRPHNTEMDLSIACALYFASRGQGMAVQTRDGNGAAQSSPYSTPARVLLSGLGADELFAGYARHEMAFTRRGLVGLIDEINLDVTRIGKRNLGRDDRVITNWARECRYPYLDEEFMSWVLRKPVWEKCGFGVAHEIPGEDDVEPAKKALRLLALRLGMNRVAREKKRAIQFGSRTAKMERGKTKGTETLG